MDFELKECSFNYYFLTAASIEQCIQSAGTNSPDIILIDIQLRRADAFELCRHLKSDPSTSSSSIILLMDQDMKPEFYQRGIESGADAFLRKPFNSYELQTQVNLLIRPRKHSSEREKKCREPEHFLSDNTVQSENSYRIFFRDSSDGICIHDFAGRIYEANRSAYSYLGYRKDEFLKMSLLDIMTRECAEMMPERAQTLREKGYCVFENTFITKGGTLLPVEVSSRIISFEGIEAIISIARDITERKTAQKKLLESEEMFSKVFHSNAALMVITTLDEGRIIECNDAFLESTGYTADEILGMNSVDCRIFPDSAARDLMAERLKKEGSLSNVDMMITTKSGEARQLSFSMEIIRLNGKDCIVSMMNDVTEIKRIEKALKESEAELKLTLDAMTDGIWKLDIDKNEFFYSSQYYTMLGYEPYEFPPTIESWKNLIHPDDLQRVLTEIGNFYINEKPADNRYYLEFRLKTKCGDYKWVRSISKVVERDRYGNAIRIIGNHEDITERKLIELELINAKKDAEDASHFKSALLSNMNHEFRTPLNGILGMADLLRKEIENPVQREMVDLINISGQRLYETLDAFMKMAQLMAGKLSIIPKAVLCSSVVKRIIVKLSDQAAEKNLPLFLEIHQDSEIMIDEKILHDILQYLVINALKFTEKGEVRIILDAVEIDGTAMAIIHVKDTGIGIPFEYYEQILQEFRQLSEGITRIYEGMGLGLSLAKKMTELLKGTFSFESNLDQGSTFSVAFPVISAAAAGQYTEPPGVFQP
ncbi:MAG: PAS domain S-box protein [Vulcanimicrobiota bacterium]